MDPQNHKKMRKKAWNKHKRDPPLLSSPVKRRHTQKDEERDKERKRIKEIKKEEGTGHKDKERDKR